MTQHFSRAAATLAILSLATIGIAGCASAAPGGGAAPTAPPTHSATGRTSKPKPIKPPPALDTTAPAALLNIPCTSLATPAELAAYQGPVTLISQPAALATGDLADALNYLPVSDYLRAAGAVDCVWSAGPVDHYDPTHIAVKPYIEISVQFNAAKAWAIFAAENGVTGKTTGMCDGDYGGTSICQLDTLVGTGTWIEVYSRKASGPKVDGAGDIMTTATAAVMAAGAPATLTAPQAGTPPLGSECQDFATPAAVQSALGISTAVAPKVLASQPDYPDTIATWYSAENTLADHPCAFESGSRIQTMVTWIPGGAWAWAEDKTQTLADAPLQPLTLTGLKVNDSANIRCAAGNKSCVVDLVLSGNWIEATVPATSTAADKQTAVTAVAQAIVNTVG